MNKITTKEHFNHRTNRYCHVCGSRLRYDAHLSTPKAKNEDRLYAYECQNCYEKTGKITFNVVQIREVINKKGHTVYQTIRTMVLKGKLN